MGIGTSFFEHFAHFHFRSHLQTLINRESHQIKLYQSQRCCRQATGTDTPNATLSCHLSLPLLTQSPVCVCVCMRVHGCAAWDEYTGQSSVQPARRYYCEGKRSGDIKPSVYLYLLLVFACCCFTVYVSAAARVCSHAVGVCGCASERVCMRQASVRCQPR